MTFSYSFQNLAFSTVVGVSRTFPSPTTLSTLIYQKRKPSSSSHIIIVRQNNEKLKENVRSRLNFKENDNLNVKEDDGYYYYKDDCFGFTTFLAGIAVQDIQFTFLYTSLSLFAGLLTKLCILPPDKKRPSIVSRKVPGIIAVLMLLFIISSSSISTTAAGENNNSITFLSSSSSLFEMDPDDLDFARKIQFAICSFSAVTSFLDIRWRDRIDYGPDDQVV